MEGLLSSHFRTLKVTKPGIFTSTSRLMSYRGEVESEEVCSVKGN